MSGENPELKAGHPPAVKAGGMRVVTKHRHKEPDADAYDDKYKDSVNPMGPPIKVDIQPHVSLSGGLSEQDMRQQKPESIKVYHEKPHPSHEKHSPQKHHHQQNFQIQQPKRAN